MRTFFDELRDTATAEKIKAGLQKAAAGTGNQIKRLWGSGWKLPVVVLLAAAAAGGGAGYAAASWTPSQPYASCAGSERVLDTYLYSLEESIPSGEDLAEIGRYESGYAAVGQVFIISDCEPDELLSRIDVDSLSEPGQAMLWAQLAEVANRRDFPNLPPEAEELLAPDGGTASDEPAPSPLTGPSDGKRLVVFADEDGAADCDCYQVISEVMSEGLAAEEDVTVQVVDSGPVGWELEERYGWETVPEDFIVPEAVHPERPAALYIVDDNVVRWFAGEDELRERYEIRAAVTNPVDPGDEQVPEDLLYGVGTCNGNEARGALFNVSDRPIHAAVGTDPAVEFRDDGTIRSHIVWHDLGIIEPWGQAPFDVETGEPYLAPCALTATAAFADGERLGDDYEPGERPEDFPATLEEAQEMVDDSEFPEPVIPQGVLPGPSDVQPID